MKSRTAKSQPSQRTKPHTSQSANRTPARKTGFDNSRAQQELLQSLFQAAVSRGGSLAFATDCAVAIKTMLDVEAVAVSVWSGADAVAGASCEASLELATQIGKRRPHATALSGKPDILAAPTTAAGFYKTHDAAMLANGWRCCFSSSLRSASNDVVGAVTLYSMSRRNLNAARNIFRCSISPTLTAAIAAQQSSGCEPVATQQFDSLASTIPGVVYQRTLSPDGDIRYTYLSEGARELFGVDPQAVVKDPEVLFRTYSEDYKQSFRKRLIEASETLTKWDVEASIVLPDGSKRTTHAIAKPERLADGTVLWTGIILDASRAKEAEEKLVAANRQVQLANQAKSAFLAKMSHEMRTPLNGVMGMGDLLLKTDLTPRQTRLATTLCDSAKGLLGIINDVLDLSRIEAGHFKLDLQEFNLRHCVEDAVELCATNGYRKGLEVNLIVCPETPIGVKSDPVRLRQVLINLIGNAIKFTENGEVVVRLSVGDRIDGRNAVTFEVVDTGIGIDKTSIGRLFEPFAQADASISRRFGGTGLGLSITRHLVELLGGEVSLTSERGRGTTVRFVIPFEVTASSQTPTILNHLSLDGARVLVIDDRCSNRDMTGANLVGSGARVEFAVSETDAFDQLDRAVDEGDPFLVAIIDRVRPRCSGLHLCRTIRANMKLSATALVVQMSANWNANPIDQKGLDRSQFLCKPVRRSDLMAAIARLLNIGGSHAESKLVAAPKPVAVSLLEPLRLRVLLVEDNATNIEVAREYLNEFECRITVAMNGIEAITAYDRSSYDIILMDTQMPELDGLSATRRIREAERAKGLPRVPIIALTANAYDSDRALAIEAGSDDFLSKPYTDVQLRDTLTKWAKSRVDRVADQDVEPMVPASVRQRQPASVSTNDERLDSALHRVLVETRPAFLGRLLRAFLSSIPETTMSLRAAIKHRDEHLLRQVAHSLKSGGANVGAKRLAERCRALEMQLRLGADVADCHALASEVEGELALAEMALSEILAHLAQSSAEVSQTG